MKKNKKKTSNKNKLKPKRKIRISRPVFCGPDVLPFLDKGFNWTKFERFSRHLLEHLFPGSIVSLYGKAGNKQKGIDLLISESKLLPVAVQCKQYQNYTISNFKAAKKALKIKTKKNILFLACEADVKLRDEVLKDPNWDVWDCNDITAKVMRLDPEVRYRLVKTYFGVDWATSFSNHQEYTPFASPIDFFKPQLNENRIFNHCGPYLGRVPDLKALSNFIPVHSKKAFILSGVGGVGKSRLIWELSKSAKRNKWNVVFVREGITASKDDFQKLRGNKHIFVFDDAHRISNLNNYFAYFLQADFEFKIIISTRPQGRERIRLDLRQLNFEEREIHELSLSPLNLEDSRKLIVRLLPQLNGMYVNSLARIAKDSLLIGVMACNLIKRKELSLRKLPNEADIRDQALFRFKDELLGKLTTESNCILNRSLLEVIAAFGPINVSHPETVRALSAFVGITEVEFKRSFGELDAYGLLVDRGNLVRISPDILSDCILEETCILKNGKSSGFFDKANVIQDSGLRLNLLRNVAELDWRKEGKNAASTKLLADFWNDLLAIIPNSSLSQKNAIAAMVEPIAYFQPNESLGVVKKLLSARSEIVDENNKWEYRIYIEKISKIIRDVIVSGIQVEDAVFMLWSLGKDDEANLNPHPDHPIRILQDLSSYSKNMSISHYERILDSFDSLIQKYNKADFHSPILLLKGFLAKTAHSTHSEGNKIIMTPFHISSENTKKMRGRIFDLLREKISSSNLKEAHATVRVLEEGLRGPSPIFGMKITEKQIRQWDQEIETVMSILIKEIDEVKFSLIKLEIKKVLKWFSKYGAKKNLWTKLNSFFAKHTLNSDEEAYLIFQIYNYGDLVSTADLSEYKLRETELNSFGKQATENLLKKFPMEKDLVKKVNKIASEFSAINENATFSFFSHYCAASENANNEKICIALLSSNSHYLESSFAIFLSGVVVKNFGLASKILHSAIELKNPSILSSIAGDFWKIFENELENLEVKKIFELFLESSEDYLRNQALWGIRMLNYKKAYTLVVEFLEKSTVGSSENAKNLLSLIDETYGLPLELVSAGLARNLLEKIKDIDSIEDHDIQEFIELCANKIPQELIDFLIYRIRAARKPSAGRYSALPHLGFKNGIRLNVIESEIQKILEKIALCLAEAEGLETYWLPKLFYDIAKNNLEISLELITQLVKSGDRNKIDLACELITNLKHNLVFEKVEWISDLLKYLMKANQEEAYLRVRGSFFALGTRYERSGTRGEPMPQDVSLVANSKEVWQQAKDNIVIEFYKDLEEYGVGQIQKTKKDAELDDE